MDYLKTAMEEANYADKSAEVRLAFALGFLRGALECVRRSGLERASWADDLKDEFEGMMKEFDKELVNNLTSDMRSQRN